MGSSSATMIVRKRPPICDGSSKIVRAFELMTHLRDSAARRRGSDDPPRRHGQAWHGFNAAATGMTIEGTLSTVVELAVKDATHVLHTERSVLNNERSCLPTYRLSSSVHVPPWLSIHMRSLPVRFTQGPALTRQRVLAPCRSSTPMVSRSRTSIMGPTFSH